MEFRELADLFEVAVRIERHSVNLYVKLHDAVRSSRAREVFSILAAAKEKQLGAVRRLLEETVDYTPHYVYPGEYELFVDGMAARVLESAGPPAGAERISSAEEAIERALTSEKAALSFYGEQLSKFKGRPRRMIEELMAEGKAHRKRLEDLLASYPASGP